MNIATLVGYKNFVFFVSFMKKLLFLELEGVLTGYKEYVPNDAKVKEFVESLHSFCKENKIEVFLVSGHHETIAKQKMFEKKFHEFFDEKHFVFVDEIYIESKTEDDKKLHRDNLAKDLEFNDSFFKQILIQRILKEKDLNEKDVLLLCNDVWVDGYYTSRFSKVDFALFEDNLTDRGKKIDRINGLAYFNFDFDSVKQLLIDFPNTNLGSLDKYVFDVMNKVLVGDNIKSSIKQSILKKRVNG
jgi:hypothetical protein